MNIIKFITFLSMYSSNQISYPYQNAELFGPSNTTYTYNQTFSTLKKSKIIEQDRYMLNQAYYDPPRNAGNDIGRMQTKTIENIHITQPLFQGH